MKVEITFPSFSVLMTALNSAITPLSTSDCTRVRAWAR
jgi:hypothetical protein